jgi:hypothetical protein
VKPVWFHPAADAEMVDAAVWYGSRQEDLGKRFLTAVRDALNRIQVNPELFPLVEGNVRRCLTKTFPFGVLFRHGPDFIAVVAVMHLHREPGYWQKRRFEQDDPGH